MLIGVPKEIKVEEHRVGLTPASAWELVSQHHVVLVQKDAGANVGFTNQDYQQAGANIVDTAEAIFAEAELIVKVKEPQPIEYSLLREGQILFTYLHLAPAPMLADALIQSGCIAIAYETVTGQRGDLPLLSPMSQVAGRLAIQAGAHCLEKPQGGSGVLLGGVPGVLPGKVVIIGGGVVGSNAARMAVGLGAHVTILDNSLYRLQELELQFEFGMETLFATETSISEQIATADLVIGAVLRAGEAAPQVVTRSMLRSMRPGSVIVDVAIDQGGCIETSQPTTHTHPTFVEEGIVHYCVSNMPGAVPRTATLALNNATLPFISQLANKGEHALLENPHLLPGLNIYRGVITHEGIAHHLHKPYQSALKMLT